MRMNDTWPVFEQHVWGFYAGTPRRFVPRDEAVAWALTHLDPSYRHVFYWWDTFLDHLTTLPLLPQLVGQDSGLTPVWSFVGLDEWVYETFGADNLEADDVNGLVAFFNAWADDFVRQHAPDLEARRALGGPLGRRLVARLIRPRAPWDVNDNERRLLRTAMNDWAQEARQLVSHRIRNHPAIRLTPHPSGALTVIVEDCDAEELAEWATRFRPWQNLLAGSHVQRMDLNPVDADVFWRQEMPILVDRGTKILLDDKPWNPSLRLRGRVSQEPGWPARAIGLEHIVQVHWEVMLGDQRLTFEELERLVHAAYPLVRVGQQFVALDDEMARTVRDAYEKASKSRVKLVEALRWAVEGSSGPVEVVSAGAVYEILRALNGPVDAWTPPPGFRGVLRPYQQEGVSWLVRRMKTNVGALLADDMGLGKTIEVIAALAVFQAEERLTAPVLVVAPLSVVNNWEREFRRFTPQLSVASHLGPNRAQDEALIAWVGSSQVVLTTYDVLVRDSAWLSQLRWLGVVADEAQHIKNPATKRARALRRLSAQWRIALTGTPVENRLHDLWAEMEFLNPGYLGGEREFRQRFERGDTAEINRLKRLLAPFVLRRVKTDPTVMPDLPDKVESYEWTYLTPEQVALYQAIVDSLFRQVASPMTRIKRRGAIVAALTHLKQVTNHPALYLHESGPMRGRSGKLERLEELLEAIVDVRERVVVFTQYVAWIQLLAPYLRRHFRVPVLTFHGSLSKNERDRVVDDFNQAAGPAVLLASLKAGGVGLNLAAAQHVIHYDRWWNPAAEDQATDRVWRLGQRSLVTVHKLVTRGTVEERIDALISQKRQLSRDVLADGTSEQWMGELTNQELRDLIELRDSLTPTSP
jgi:non-specific serine/threonine protein kinase